MMSTSVRCALALAMTLGLGGAAQAALVTLTYEATVSSGPLAGETGTGTLIYDDENPDIPAERVISPANHFPAGTPGLQLTFTFDGQTFAEQNDARFDQGAPLTSTSPQLAFKRVGMDDYAPYKLGYFLTAGRNGVSFDNRDIQSISFFDERLEEAPSGSTYDLTTNITVTMIPVPASLPLLISGLAGIGLLLGWRRAP